MGNGNRPTPEFRREAVRLAPTSGRTRRPSPAGSRHAGPLSGHPECSASRLSSTKNRQYVCRRFGWSSVIRFLEQNRPWMERAPTGIRVGGCGQARSLVASRACGVRGGQCGHGDASFGWWHHIMLRSEVELPHGVVAEQFCAGAAGGDAAADQQIAAVGKRQRGLGVLLEIGRAHV